MRPKINIDFGAELLTPPPSPFRSDDPNDLLTPPPSPSPSFGDLDLPGLRKGYMTPRAAYLKRHIERSMDHARRLTPRTAHLRHLAAGLSGGFTYLVDKVMSPKASAPARIRTTRHGDAGGSTENMSEGNSSNSGGGGIGELPPLLKLLFIVICACVVLGGGRMLGIAMRERRSIRQRRWPHAELGDDAHGLYLYRPAAEKVPVVGDRPPPAAAAAAAASGEVGKYPPLRVAGVDHHNEAATSAARAASDMAQVVTRVQKQMDEVRLENKELRERASSAEAMVLQQRPAADALDVHDGGTIAEDSDRDSGEAFELG